MASQGFKGNLIGFAFPFDTAILVGMPDGCLLVGSLAKTATENQGDFRVRSDPFCPIGHMGMRPGFQKDPIRLGQNFL
jgi:hypothetical protein